MSVYMGDRATYQGASVVVMEPVSFLGENRWRVEKMIPPTSILRVFSWGSAIACESDLSNVQSPSFQDGDSVRVGSHPKALVGTITAVIFSDRPLYEVTIPSKIRISPEGIRWTRDEMVMTLGGEALRGISES